MQVSSPRQPARCSHPRFRQGRSARAFKAGATFTVPTHAMHGGKVSDTELKLIGVDVEGRSPRLRWRPRTAYGPVDIHETTLPFRAISASTLHGPPPAKAI